MTELKLLTSDDSEPKPKPKTWLQERLDFFIDEFKNSTGRKCPILYPQLASMLSNKAMDALNGWATVNMETSEIIKGYPDIDVWEEQVRAFFKDEFAGSKAGFGFGYFLKGFGTFVKYEAVKRNPSDPILTNQCKKCETIMRYPRSHWLKYKNQHGRCASCQERFAVNDVLNSIPDMADIFIPNK
jgi:hypothetical protein